MYLDVVRITETILRCVLLVQNMKRGRNVYKCETSELKGSQRATVKNGRFRLRRFDSIEGEQQWTMENGEIPLFDDIGTLPNQDSVLVGEVNGGLYLVRALNKPRLVCRFKSYESYESDDFIWLVGGGGDARDPVIKGKGKYLIHLPTGSFCNCSKPPRMTEFGSKFETANMVITWTGSGFDSREKRANEEREEISEEDVTDMRKEELEEFLSENVELEVITGADYMDEVDLSETPRPMVREFYEMDEGDFPEDPDGDFEPPSQDQFALAAYHKFREMSDGDAFREETKRSWIKRLKRTWSSLVRDAHFSFMMFQEQKESECFDNAEFDIDKDIQEGIDFLIEHEGTEYHVNLFIDTRNSRKFLRQKKEYRHPENDAVAVEVPMKRYGNKKKSVETEGEDLWLYSEEHIDAIKRIALDGEEKVEKDGTVLSKRIGETN